MRFPVRDVHIWFDAGEFEESRHPRGQPKNKGEFVKSPKNKSASPKKDSASTIARNLSDVVNAKFIKKFEGAVTWVDSGVLGTDDAAAWAKIPSNQRSAVEAYTGEDSISLSSKQKKAMKDLFASDVAVTTIDMLVHRGLMLRPEQLTSLKSAFESGEKAEIKEQGYVSTSLSESVVKKFGNSEIEILLPRGSRAIYVAPISEVPQEKEVLLPEGTTFTVVALKKTSNGRDHFRVVAYTPNG